MFLFLTLNIFHIFFVAIVHYEQKKYLSEGFFLSKYYYPKYKDEQMLYLTSFKNSSRFSSFLDIWLQVYIKLFFPEKGSVFPAILLKLKIL